MVLFRVIATTGGPAGFSENGIVEWSQVVVLLSAAVVFAIVAARRAQSRALSISLAAAVVVAVVREQDALLDTLNPLWGWKLPVALIALAGAAIVYRDRQRFKTALGQLVRGRAFTLLWCGFVIAVPLAQQLGHEPLLEALWGDYYVRDQKRALEEMLELIGYAVILMGALELLLSGKDRRPFARRAGEPDRARRQATAPSSIALVAKRNGATPPMPGTSPASGARRR